MNSFPARGLRFFLVRLLFLLAGLALPMLAFAQPTISCPTCVSGAVLACSGDALVDYLDITGESAGSSYTVAGDVLNAGTLANFSSFILNDSGNDGLGTVTISVTSANGNLAPTPVAINFAHIQAAFVYNQSNLSTCYQVSFTNNSSAANGVIIDQYAWDFGFPGGTSTAANPVVTFPGPGQYQVSLTATDNTLPCSDDITSTVTVNGPEPLVNIEANGFPPPINDQGDTCIVAFCVVGSNVDYNLIISNAASNSSGASNQTFTFTNLATNTVETLPLNITYPSSQTGYAYFDYTIEDSNGCSATKTYAVYKSDLQNLQFTCTQQGVDNYCVGETITFNTGSWQQNPADATYRVQFICEATGAILLDTTWYDVPPATFEFTPNVSSCGCNIDNNFQIRSFSSSPCDPPGIPYTSYFGAGFPVDAEFSVASTPPACLNESLSFDWLFDNGYISNNPGICKPQFNWTITNLATNADVPPTTGDFTAHMDHTFAAAGNYEVRLNISSACGTDMFSQNVCVYPSITEASLGLNYSMGIPPATCIPFALTPEILSINNLTCGSPVYTWRLYQLPGVTLINTYTGTSPDIPISIKGSYRLQLTVQVENCGTLTFSEDFLAASNPVITASNPVFNACNSGSFICLDDLFCIDTCYSALSDFNIAVYEGATNCNNPSGTLVFSSSALPQQHLLTQPCTDGCQYQWNLPTNTLASYTVVVEAENGCGSATPVCITINFGTAVSANIPDFVCSGASINLSALSPQAGCNWQYFNGSAWVAAPSNMIISQSTYLQLNCPGYCPLQDTIDVYPPFFLTVTGNAATICGGDVFTFNLGTLPASANITEYTINGADQPGNQTSYNSAPLFNNASFTIHATDVNLCEADTIITVSVESAPTLSCGSPSYCESDVNAVFDFTDYLSFEGSYPSTADWTIENQAINATQITVGEVISLFGNPPAAPLELDLSFSLTTDAGCSYSDTCEIEVEYQGTVNSPDIHHCAGSLLTINEAGNGEWNTDDLPGSAPDNFTGTSFNWTPLPADTGLHILTYNSGCSVTNYPIRIHYSEVTLTADDTEICGNAVVNFLATISPGDTDVDGYTWQVNGTTVQTGGNASYSAPFADDASVSVQSTDSYGCLSSDNVLINVEESPVLNCTPITGNVYCESSDEVIQLDDLLSWPIAYPSAAVWTVCNQTISGLAPQINWIAAQCGGISSDTTVWLIYSLTSDNNCTYGDSCQVNIENQDLETEDIALCSGTTLALTGNGTWTGTALPASAPANGNYNGYVWNIPQNAAPGEYLISFSAGCGITEYYIGIYATPQPSLTLGEDVMCIESSVSINAIPVSADEIQFYYSYAGSSIDLGNAPASFAPQAWNITDTSPGEICQTAEGNYNLPDGTLLNCADTSCASIDIIDIPGLPDNADTLCFEQDFPITGNFQSFNLSVNGQNYTSSPVILEGLTGDISYQLEVLYGGGYACSLDTSASVFVVEPIEFSIDMVSDSCTGEATLNIGILQGENLNYALTADAIIQGAASLQEGVNNLQFNTSITEDTTYPVSIEITNGGCNTEEWQGEVLVYAAPDLEMDVSSGSLLCAGEEVCLDIVNLGSSTITAASFDMGNGVIYNFAPQDIVIPCTSYNAVLNATTYTVIGSLTGQCTTDVEYLNILIQPQDVLVTMQEYPDGFCPGDTLDIAPASISGSGPFSITYSFVPDINPFFTGPSEIIVPNGLSDEFLLVNIEVNGTCGVDDDLATVYIRPTPETEAIAGSACMNVPVIFENESSPLQGEFYWHIIEDDTTFQSLNFQYAFPDNSTYEIQLTQIIEDQCPGMDTLFVTVHEIPKPSIAYDGNCFLEPTEEVRIYTSSNYATYYWEIDDELFNTADPSITFRPGEVAPGDTLLDIYLRISDEFGCIGDTSMDLAQCEAPYLFVPNCFTPDYDGINDVFCVAHDNLISFEIWIFDRWGQRVYYSSDPNDCWTGSVNGGEYFAPDGVYQWKIIYNKQPGSEDKLFKRDAEKWKYPPIKGHVVLVR